MSNLVTIDFDKCYECGEPKDDMHHIVPKSKGGTKTIPLCLKCHGLVHDRDFVRHRQLMLEGIMRAKALGKYTGRKLGTTLTDEELFAKHDIIVKLINKHPTMSLRKLEKLGDAENHCVSINTIKRIKDIIKNNEQSTDN
jgi:hypothetical protein